MRVRDGVWLLGVDGAPVCWAHHIRVDVVGIGTTATLTAGKVAWWHEFAGVQGGDHGVLVAFE